MKNLKLKTLCITEDKHNSKKEEQDLLGAITTYLSDTISKGFTKYIKTGQVGLSTFKMDTSEPVSARRTKADAVGFFISPKDLSRRTVEVEVIVKVNIKD